MTAFRETEKRHDAKRLLLRRKRMVHMRQRLKIAKARQSDSAHQSLRTCFQMSLFSACEIGAFESAVER
jgi:hypothetical protein